MVHVPLVVEVVAVTAGNKVSWNHVLYTYVHVHVSAGTFTNCYNTQCRVLWAAAKRLLYGLELHAELCSFVQCKYTCVTFDLGIILLRKCMGANARSRIGWLFTCTYNVHVVHCYCNSIEQMMHVLWVVTHVLCKICQTLYFWTD